MNKKSQSLYQNNFRKYGVDSKSLLWKSPGAAHQRFRQMWKEVDFTNKKVLDIGCGFGEFGRFLFKRYEGVDYTGIDIMPDFIEAAKKMVPNGKFFVADYLKDKINDKYDVVVASGVLNGNLGASSLEYRKKAIKKMFSLTTGTLVFNMLGAHPQPLNNLESNVYYSDSLEILKYCMTLTRRVILRANYHPKDFTIVMERVTH